jgi:hypothetical protein
MHIDDRSIVAQPVPASSADLIDWHSRKLGHGEQDVRNLQMRIAKAVEILPA